MRRSFCSLALLLFAVHAILPTGFMPDLGAIKDGRFEIVICTGLGTETLFVDQSGHPAAPKPSDTSGKHAGAYSCPFGAAIGKAFAVSVATGVAYQYFATASDIVAATVTAPQSSPELSVLGPRAPPFRLG